MAASTGATCLETSYLESNSSSEKDSPCFEKQEENEGRRMVLFRKVMRKCLDKIMAAGRWVLKTEKTNWTLQLNLVRFVRGLLTSLIVDSAYMSRVPIQKLPASLISFYFLAVHFVMFCSQEKFASCFTKIKERNPDEFKSITEQLMQHLQNNIEVQLMAQMYDHILSPRTSLTLVWS